MVFFLLKFMFLVTFFSGFYSFCSMRSHLLMTLLSLEFVMLSLFMIVFIYLGMLGVEFYYSMVFLTFVVCEGALGLGILVSLVRFYGNDYFQSYVNLRC